MPAVASTTPMEKAFIDVVRVALSGDDAGVRQLCRRFIKRPPSDAAHPNRVAAELSLILSSSPVSESAALRGSGSRTAPSPVFDTRGLPSTPPQRTRSAVDPDTGLQLNMLEDSTDHRPPLLGRDERGTIDNLVRERLEPQKLAAFGIEPSRSLLIQGPPGVGKTMTARYIASQLDLPLMTLNIASLMSSLLGKTGRNLQSALIEAKSTPCVFLMDEFDALAKTRNDDSDVGELKRIVTVLLQQLDQWPGDGLLIAATNHPELLDRAIQRRFDQILSIGLPDLNTRIALLKASTQLAKLELSPETLKLIGLAMAGSSPADIERWINQKIRVSLLANGSTKVAEDLSIAAIEHLRKKMDSAPEARQQISYVANKELHFTQRQIAEWLGVSHPTIGKDIAKATMVDGAMHESRGN